MVRLTLFWIRPAYPAKFFSIYYDLPVASATGAAPVEQSEASSAAAMVAAVLPPTILAGTSGLASAVPSNHEDASGVFSRRSLMDAANAAE